MENVKEYLKTRLSEINFQKLIALNNERMFNFVADSISICNPDNVFVSTDDKKDKDYIRKMAIQTASETKLNIQGHTCHFDNEKDQARDKANTKYLLPKGLTLGERLNSMDKDEGLAELKEFFKDSMKGRDMIVAFYCLGPQGSEFSIPCIQITDSYYVAHSENILYRPGYEQFKKAGTGVNDFFRFRHTQGELEGAVSKNLDKRRIYMDLEDNTVYSTNTQYAGNTVGLKKLALRLAISKADREGWLAEHMFVMGVHGPNARVSYFTGAFPSACGKTSTAMLPGQTIIGDDIAYFKKIDGRIRSVNVEQGIFGIIRDVNPDDDPVIYDALTKPGEVIFGNVLIKDGKPYWEGMGCELPEDGINYQGKWTKDMKHVSPSHKNARYTIRISALDNKDPMLEDPKGVPVSGIVYGGRDSDTCVPVEEAFNWKEGIITKGATIESESTAATLGKQGVRTFNMMSNMDFLAIPLGKYIQNNLDFAKDIEKVPSIFSVNYFLKGEDGKFLNGMQDKKVWILWAELRANGDVEAIQTPTGYIPEYEDLVKIFKKALNKEYSQPEYQKQFTIRVPELLAKYNRIEEIYKDVEDTPKIVFDTFNNIRERLNSLKEKHGEYVNPFDLK